MRKSNVNGGWRRTALGGVASVALALPLLLPVSAASAEPSPCRGISGDKGIGGDYFGWEDASGTSGWQVIYGTWFNCSGSGVDRVRLAVSSDRDGPCITVLPGSAKFTRVDRNFRVWTPHYDGWKRC